jgi:hypothetical protein
MPFQKVEFEFPNDDDDKVEIEIEIVFRGAYEKAG